MRKLALCVALIAVSVPAIAADPPTVVGTMVPGHEWIVFSNKGGGFVNPTVTGYTRLAEKAGRWTAKEAAAIAARENALPLVNGKVNAVAIVDFGVVTAGK